MKRALAYAIAVALVAACGSSETTSTDDAGASTSSSGGSSSGATSSGDPPGDSGAICQLVTIGFDPGTVVTSVARGAGNVPWTNLDAAKDADEVFATVVLGEGEESEELRITGFGFKLPTGAVFQGVEAQLKRQAPEGGIVDGAIALVGVKNQPGRGKFIATPWPSSIVGTHHYGQATDTWGMDLNPPDVETEEFGVSLWVKRGEGAPASATAHVDSIKIRVAYCQP